MRKHKPTSMHSSRTLTARLLLVSAPVSASGGVCLWSRGGGCLPLVLGEGVSQHALGQTTPPREQNDRQV